MSYSVSIRANTQEEAKTKALNALRAQLAPQSPHDNDAEIILAAVASTIDAVPIKEGMQMVVEANGSATAAWDAVTCNYTELTGSTQSLRVYTVPASLPA